MAPTQQKYMLRRSMTEFALGPLFMFMLIVQGIGMVTVSIQSQPEIQNVYLEPTRKQQCPCRWHPHSPICACALAAPMGYPSPPCANAGLPKHRPKPEVGAV